MGSATLSAPVQAAHAPTAADLAEIADALEAVTAEGDPQKAKALLQLLIDELRVNSRAEILPTGSSRPRFAQCPKKWSVSGSNR
jgi:hypothetical protein